MMRKFTIALALVVGLAFAVGVQAQGPGGPGPGGRRPGMGMGMSGGTLFLLQNEKVQKEIELTTEQKDKITKLAKENREAMGAKWSEISKLSREERTKKMEEMSKDFEEQATKTQKKVDEILLPNQVERVKQIQLQWQLQMFPGMVLATPEVVKGLELTEEEQSKIKTINEEARKAMPSMSFTPGQRPSAEDLEKMQKSVQKSMKETETKLLDVLTAEQKEKLEKMKGPKFDTSSLMRGPGGNRRGNRGGNGGGGGGGADNPPPVN